MEEQILNSKKAAPLASTAEAVNVVNYEKFVDMSVDEDIMVDFIISKTNPERGMMKIAEEATELAEVAIKWVTKSKENKPALKTIKAEFADLVFRFMIGFASIEGQNPFENDDDEIGILMNNKIKYIYQHLKAKELMEIDLKTKKELAEV